jgi:hypothetical protein
MDVISWGEQSGHDKEGIVVCPVEVLLLSLGAVSIPSYKAVIHQSCPSWIPRYLKVTAEKNGSVQRTQIQNGDRDVNYFLDTCGLQWAVSAFQKKQFLSTRYRLKSCWECVGGCLVAWLSLLTPFIRGPPHCSLLSQDLSRGPAAVIQQQISYCSQCSGDGPENDRPHPGLVIVLGWAGTVSF